MNELPTPELTEEVQQPDAVEPSSEDIEMTHIGEAACRLPATRFMETESQIGNGYGFGV